LLTRGTSRRDLGLGLLNLCFHYANIARAWARQQQIKVRLSCIAPSNCDPDLSFGDLQIIRIWAIQEIV
jgi:hypothetical protein